MTRIIMKKVSFFVDLDSEYWDRIFSLLREQMVEMDSPHLLLSDLDLADWIESHLWDVVDDTIDNLANQDWRQAQQIVEKIDRAHGATIAQKLQKMKGKSDEKA